MQLVIGLSILACLGFVVALIFLVRKVAFTESRLPVTAEWIGQLSIERYRPMMRLLDRRDIEFLRAQPGFTPGMLRRLRMQRCQIFRGYLRSLSADFRRVCAAIRLLMLYSRHDRPDLAGLLLRHQVKFASSCLAVQLRLLFYRWGLCDVDVTGLFRTFDAMRGELRRLVPATLPVGA